MTNHPPGVIIPISIIFLNSFGSLPISILAAQAFQRNVLEIFNAETPGKTAEGIFLAFQKTFEGSSLPPQKGDMTNGKNAGTLRPRAAAASAHLQGPAVSDDFQSEGRTIRAV